MKIELNEKCDLQWEDLKYGDVFIDGDNDVCMKVGYNCDGRYNLKEKEYVLDLSSGKLFDVYKNYDIVKVVKCKLVEEEE
jgi:hypothetical protein